jgi:hypothetical protein
MLNAMSAAGEAMPKISRRLFLGSAAVSLPLMWASLTHAATADPLGAACAAYAAALEDYNANAPSEDDAAANAYAAMTWKPARDVLENWTEPAVSRDGAMAALRLAAQEEDTGYSGLTSPLLTAALAYFEQEAVQ